MSKTEPSNYVGIDLGTTLSVIARLDLNGASLEEPLAVVPTDAEPGGLEHDSLDPWPALALVGAFICEGGPDNQVAGGKLAGSSIARGKAGPAEGKQREQESSQGRPVRGHRHHNTCFSVPEGLQRTLTEHSSPDNPCNTTLCKILPSFRNAMEGASKRAIRPRQSPVGRSAITLHHESRLCATPGWVRC